MNNATLESYLEEKGYIPNYGQKLPVLDRAYQPACLMKRSEAREEPLFFKLKNSPHIIVGGLITRRNILYELVSKQGDPVAAYNVISFFNKKLEYHVQDSMPGTLESSDDLTILPWIKFYEKDGGLYLTSPIVISCRNGFCNASIHRIMLSDTGEIAIRLVPRHLYFMAREAAEKREKLPVTLVLGVHPLHIVAAATSPPMGVFELSHSTRILGSNLYKSPIHNHPIPEASIIVEGWITPERIKEGPFVDAMGTYDRVRLEPKMEIEKIYYKPSSYVQIILPGGKEHALLMGFPREASIFESVSRVVPKVHKVSLTPASGGWLHAVVSITKNNDGDGKNAIMAAFAGHPSLKHVVIVDQDIDTDDPYQVEWAIATRFQADKDLVIIRNARGSTLDPSGDNGLTAKIGIDATKPLQGSEIFEKASIPECDR
ncbi:MAG: UbiD family decarboxylase [Desulfurococcales archaeon]|nr:UbiD family decarboxylase [Desulfurococcales archaeon]